MVDEPLRTLSPTCAIAASSSATRSASPSMFRYTAIVGP